MVSQQEVIETYCTFIYIYIAWLHIPSGKWVIFNSHASLPEGSYPFCCSVAPQAISLLQARNSCFDILR